MEVNGGGDAAKEQKRQRSATMQPPGIRMQCPPPPLRKPFLKRLLEQQRQPGNPQGDTQTEAPPDDQQSRGVELDRAQETFHSPPAATALGAQPRFPAPHQSSVLDTSQASQAGTGAVTVYRDAPDGSKWILIPGEGSFPDNQYHPEGYQSLPPPPPERDPAQVALNDLLEKFRCLHELCDRHPSVTTKEATSTLSHAYGKIEELLGEDNSSLAVVVSVAKMVDDAFASVEERLALANALVDQGVVYIGCGDSKELDRALRSHPDMEVYLFYFKFTDDRDKSETWKMFSRLIAYSQEQDGKSICIAVSVGLIFVIFAFYGRLSIPAGGRGTPQHH